MSRFWVSKKSLIEALKLCEGRPDNACVIFEGEGKVINGSEYTITKIEAFGKKKTVKQEFSKLYL